MGARFIHTADWQLGMRRRSLSAGAQARFTEARFDAVTRIGAIAREEACDFVLVAGDVFESNLLDRAVVTRALDELARFPCPVYLLPGNHDPLDPASIYRSPTFARKSDNVVVLDSGEPIEVSPGVQLVAAPWTSKRPLVDLVHESCNGLEPSSSLRVCVAHGCVDALAPDRDNPAAISLANLEAAVDGGRLHYVALGDRHSVTSVGRTGRVWYSGSPEATDYGEVAAGRVLVVQLDSEACSVTQRPVGQWSFQSRRVEVCGEPDVAALDRELQEIDAKSRVVLRLGVVGQLNLAGKARLDEVLERAQDVFASVETWEASSDLVFVPDALDVEGLEISGFARSALQELVDAATAGGEAAHDALSLFHRLARGVA